MAANISASGAEKYVEERLIAGLLTGSLHQHKELLDMLEDVDSRMIKEKTLLHVGVGLGKADWVEELLARGAHTEITDDGQQNALSSAEEMVRQFPDDVERCKVLNLVSLVHRRDQVILRRLKASSSRSTDHVTPMASPECDIASLKSSVDSLRREMKSLLRQLSSSLEELKAQVCGRDTLLRYLEEAVTSTAEDVRSIKCGLIGEASLSQPTCDPARARQECVDAMMRKTRIVYGSGVDKVRRLYERLYDGDEITACIIKYLIGDDRVKVMGDFEAEFIRRMKEKVVFLDGTHRNGSELCSFCDFESETVYLGARDCSDDSEKVVCTRLAWALSQLSLQLVFDNEGRPYSKGDVECEREWMRAIEEVEDRRKRGEGLHGMISYALNQKTLKAKVCWLAAAVPSIMTFDGPKEGRAKLQQQAPLLFSLYSNNVIGTLLASGKR
ncbi:uncharacterized protein LOC124172374 [Ischnura elegans]|uniref:uncharacterized protein LOC124172374 n=1 Tax=Ischnura elegans TaxID=197161 RepID=UPI001ED8A12B|nr:uncharacterized protein LOC124172374 [Ischnura elegans]XP_046407773.1 uncharacterized protein LOC124172374 [Ischnura elegans]XP_046407774.1 uncharacterized protein LOC124172374 [Ischnura elegans]XP_046407775.1 uncharacterized protein LOC124172374 [Ischnura elegans]XP_046407777.1 uncharacterized protein LOC124172374 [Ischnura elegans]